MSVQGSKMSEWVKFVLKPHPWKRAEGCTREGRGESSGTVAFIDSVAVQAISSRIKAEKVLKAFIL